MKTVHAIVEQGTLKGTTETDLNGTKYYSFKGIPYAKPPVGKLRFKSPQPPEKWTGIRDATKDTGACYARDSLFDTVDGSEDCLVLNIYTPELLKNGTALKPVLFWIHGGGFNSGSNDSNVYGPQFLITEDVVIIAINYRLGMLGFLALGDPSLGVTGNTGCKDMVMALKWVQVNIKQFSGDPNNVTIFGESAGGVAVHSLMLSPMAKGLFHKAIAQSGCIFNPWAMARNIAKEIVDASGCPHTDDEAVIRFLQELSIEELLRVQESIPDSYAACVQRPIGIVLEKGVPSESAFLPDDPLNLISKGKYNKVPLMMGYTADEAFLYQAVLSKMGIPVSEDLEEMVPHLLKLEKGSDASKSVADKIRSFYFGNEVPNENNKDKQCKEQSDSFFNHGIYNSVKRHAATSKYPVYLYKFSVDAKLNFLKVVCKINRAGTCHGDELGYLFKMAMLSDNLSSDSIEMKTVRRMAKLWANFARTGNPNSVEDVIWKPFTKAEMNFLDIGEELTPGVNLQQERMAFWDSIYEN